MPPANLLPGLFQGPEPPRRVGLLFGGSHAGGGWQVFPESRGLLIALLPPGAFVLLGLMIALGRAHAAAAQRRAAATPPPVVVPGSRA